MYETIFIPENNKIKEATWQPGGLALDIEKG